MLLWRGILEHVEGKWYGWRGERYLCGCGRGWNMAQLHKLTALPQEEKCSSRGFCDKVRLITIQ